MYSRGKYILIQSLLMLLSPISSFVVSLRFFKNPTSLVFIVIFFFYFGMHMWLGNDATSHYMEMMVYYRGYSLEEVLNNPLVYMRNSDPYNIALKFILSRITTSPMIFGGVICSIYTVLVLHFMLQFKEFFKEKSSVICGMMLLATLAVVEFSWYQGVRYWPGVMFFAGFFLRYLNKRKWYLLLVAFMCPVFHFALYLLDIAVVVSWLLGKCGKIITSVLLALSFVVRSFNVDLLPYALSHIPFLGKYLQISLTNQRIRANVLEAMVDHRMTGNQFYLHRTDFLFVFGLLIAFCLFLQHAKFDKKYRPLLFLSMTLLMIANFEYVDIVFFDRFYKLSLLMFYSYLTFVICQNKQRVQANSVIYLILIGLPLVYAILTQIVVLRQALFSPELWFGNFFIDWSGGIDQGVISRRF